MTAFTYSSGGTVTSAIVYCFVEQCACGAWNETNDENFWKELDGEHVCWRCEREHRAAETPFPDLT